ncbi:hypothetical protein Tco_0852664, partial [Tanacetum coccineum]
RRITFGYPWPEPEEKRFGMIQGQYGSSAWCLRDRMGIQQDEAKVRKSSYMDPSAAICKNGGVTLADANLHVPLDEIKVDKTLCFVEEPVEIMDREIRKLKRRKVVLVKVRWNSKRGPEFT